MSNHQNEHYYETMQEAKEELCQQCIKTARTEHIHVGSTIYEKEELEDYAQQNGLHIH